MLRTRLWMGAVLIVLMIGVLVVDERTAGWYPFLFGMLIAAGMVACFELRQFLPEATRPRAALCYAGLVALIAANWAGHVTAWPRGPWFWVGIVFAAVVSAGFLAEMYSFRGPGNAVGRMALLTWMVAYLGFLPSFLAQLRWRAEAGAGVGQAVPSGSLALALAVFVPKAGDIGAYFTGRFLGRHRMAPVLSPKKTWEGAAGGMIAAVAVTIGIDRLGPIVPGGILGEVGFGLTVGAAGIVGDLAESLIKRDFGQKDASQVVPGFGGVLDVIDSVIFAAPVAYCWLG